MKKLSFLALVISLLVLTSCTQDEDNQEIFKESKESLVEQMIIEFTKSAVKTGRLQEFRNSISQKSVTDNLSESEQRALIIDFMEDQTPAFLDLYHQLKAMKVTAKEFYSIAHQFEDLRLNILNNVGKSSKWNGCGVNSELLDAIYDWIWGCDE
ncbi:hypothetical protein J8281_12855 [Aquimarina sp. U1-2]|uniref:hypothetical protein n=1 Tax=Aquimarina sp. U1-2 TaxID=2823141 RepID=UPI001AED0FAD|nr:hypothetical protein [Aquimarina sp. U1-2]MBP2833078.1 hypothetical protein [Aquimarina sp. U1-2]